MKTIKSMSLLMLIFVLVLTACSTTETNTESTGTSETTNTESSNEEVEASEKVITLGQVSEVANLNPVLYPRTPDTNVQSLIFDTLVAPDENLEFVEALASSWDISEDGKTYTFHLVENATWHDGVAFTADDVVFTLTSLADPTYIGGADSRVSSIVGVSDYKDGTSDSILGITKVDDYTLNVELVDVNAAFLGQMNLAILPKHILEGIEPGEWEKADFNRQPIGTGKYKFVTWESGQYIELVKNDQYFASQPNIDRIIYKFGDATTLTAALINGEIDVVESIQTSEVELLDVNEGTSAYIYPTLNVYYVGLNQLNEDVSDIRVRQALSYALDKDLIVGTVFGEYAFATNDIFPESHWTHSEDVSAYDYDPTKAEALLEEAGYAKDSSGYFAKDGERLHFVFDMVTKGQQEADLAQMIQQGWDAVGIEMEIREQDFSTLAFTRLLPQDADGNSRAVTADDFDMYMLGFGVEVDPDEYRSYFTSSTTPPNGMNFINYANDSIDALFEDSMVETDQAKRMDIFHEIGETISEDIAWIPLYDISAIAGVSDKVTNFAADFRGITYQISDWDITQ